jgi:hypothetical protein
MTTAPDGSYGSSTVSGAVRARPAAIFSADTTAVGTFDVGTAQDFEPLEIAPPAFDTSLALDPGSHASAAYSSTISSSRASSRAIPSGSASAPANSPAGTQVQPSCAYQPRRSSSELFAAAERVGRPVERRGDHRLELFRAV